MDAKEEEQRVKDAARKAERAALRRRREVWKLLAKVLRGP
jgi:hypothetical protein